MIPDTHVCAIRTKLTRPVDEIMTIAAQVGRLSGMHSGWHPSCPTEAVYEIILSSGAPEDHGVLICPPQSETQKDIFEIRVHVSFGWDRNAVIEDIAALEGKPDMEIDEAIIAILTNPMPPLDHGIEVTKIETPSSKHAIAADYQAANRSLIRS